MDFKNESIWLMKGDCLERMKEIPDGSVDLVLTDPPYGTTACKWDSIIPLELMWDHLNRIIKPNGVIVMTASQPFTTVLIASNIKNFKYEWVWEKPQGTNPLHAKIMPLKSHENVVVFYNKKPKYNPQMWQSTPYVGFSSEVSKIGDVYGGKAKSKHRNNPEGTRYPKSVLGFKQERGLHPTQKPVALMEYLIKTYTNEGETVLDFTMGSGATIKAAHNLDRKAIGIEMGHCEKKGHKYEGVHWVDVVVDQMNLRQEEKK